MDFRNFTTVSVPLIDTKFGFQAYPGSEPNEHGDIMGEMWIKDVNNELHRIEARSGDYKLFCCNFSADFCFADYMTPEQIEMIEDAFDHWNESDEEVHMLVPKTPGMKDYFVKVWG